MGRTPKILAVTPEQMSKMSTDDINKLLKTSIRYAYRKHRELEATGRESKYNEKFKDVVGKTEYQALKNIQGLNRNQMLSRTSYIRRNILNKKSTIEGQRKIEENSLEIMSNFFDDFSYKRHGDDYVIQSKDESARVITHEELSDFWKMVRKLDESNYVKSYKEGSGEGLNYVYDQYFNNDITSYDDLKDIMENRYTELETEEEKKNAARNARLLSLKNKAKGHVK